MFGEKIKILREHYGYSQRELSEKIGVPSTTLSFWERTEYPSLEGIIKICDAFSMSLWEFFVDDYSQIKKMLPDYINADDAALLKILNTRLDRETRIQVKKTFLEILKLTLLNDREQYINMPEYRLLFNPAEYVEPEEGIVSPLHDYDRNE
jgi:transcriptional regulator with XRE-family HTH domain